MITCTTLNEIKEHITPALKRGKSIGLVATMGALHKGHLSLLGQSKKENDLTVCSIFVNPIQFTHPDDLAGYPRQLEQDVRLLTEEGIDLVFAPEVEEMYPPEEEIIQDIDFGRLDKVMEGKYRPGHFQGVAIVVKKLFDIIQPTRAYFGKKDYQQLTIIQQMVQLLGYPVEVIPCETVREADGLAMSSRNLRLTIGERELAPKIYEVLMFTKANAGSIPPKKLQLLAEKRLQEVPEFRVEYFEIVDRRSLLPVINWDEPEYILACTAVYLNDIRLIDNMELFS